MRYYNIENWAETERDCQKWYWKIYYYVEISLDIILYIFGEFYETLIYEFILYN